MTKNISPQTQESQKETSRTLFQISAKFADQVSDTSLDLNTVNPMTGLAVHTITASFSTPQIGSEINLVQALLEWKRELVNQDIRALSTPIITIFGDEDLSPSVSSTLVVQVISPIIMWIKQTLPKVVPLISPSCLNDLVSALGSSVVYQTRSSPVIPSSLIADQLSQYLDIIEESSDEQPERHLIRPTVTRWQE